MELDELPGAELILPGLDDVREGKNQTIGALLIAIAHSRLSQAGLEIPEHQRVEEPELTLYALLEETREGAYAYYNALLDSLNSFCNALELRQRLMRSEADSVVKNG
jgi:hypothetical protein